MKERLTITLDSSTVEKLRYYCGEWGGENEEGKVHKYVRDELLEKWYKRFELIRTKGYGLCHIKVPCLDPELDEIDGIKK